MRFGLMRLHGLLLYVVTGETQDHTDVPRIMKHNRFINHIEFQYCLIVNV